MGTQHPPEIADFISMPGVRSDRTTHLLVAAPLVGFILWLVARLAQRAFRNLPPGPKGLPIVGDVLHIADQDWMASPQRRDEYGDIPHSQCPQKPAHVPFRRDHVYKRPWARNPRHQQPTRRHRFTRKTIEHIFRSTALHIRRTFLNEAPGSPHDAIWRPVRH